MSEHFVPERATGLKPHEVNITRQRVLGSGWYGRVFLADVEVSAADGRTRHKTMAVKDFHTREKNPGLEYKHAKRAMENYAIAKAAGLRVFPTYRLNDAENKILMTLGDTDEWICIGSNKGSDIVKNVTGRELMIKPDEGTTRFIDGVLDQAELATRAHINIMCDMPFFFIDREKQERLDFVLGDMDSLRVLDNKAPRYSKEILYESNLIEMHISLKDFFRKNLGDPKQYLLLLNEVYVNKGGNLEHLNNLAGQ